MDICSEHGADESVTGQYYRLSQQAADREANSSAEQAPAEDETGSVDGYNIYNIDIHITRTVILQPPRNNPLVGLAVRGLYFAAIGYLVMSALRAYGVL